MKIAICDDDIRSIRTLNGVLQPLLEEADTLDCFTSGDALLTAHTQVPYDLLFLDIEMPGLDGIKLKPEVNGSCRRTLVVYVTNYPQYAVAAFGVRAMHYFLKPLSSKDAATALDEARKTIGKRSCGFLEIRSREGQEFVALSDILYVEACPNRQQKVHTIDQIHIYRNTLAMLEQLLDGCGFLRIHKSFLVNMDYLRRITDNRQVVMADGTALPIAHTKDISALRDALSRWRTQ